LDGYIHAFNIGVGAERSGVRKVDCVKALFQTEAGIGNRAGNKRFALGATDTVLKPLLSI
jgi:hypothetical protein